MVTYDPATANIGGEFTVVSMANFKYGIKGMQDLDEVKLRYTETGELMSWQWGYKYTGIVDDVLHRPMEAGQMGIACMPG